MGNLIRHMRPDASRPLVMIDFAHPWIRIGCCMYIGASKSARAALHPGVPPAYWSMVSPGHWLARFGIVQIHAAHLSPDQAMRLACLAPRSGRARGNGGNNSMYYENLCLSLRAHGVGNKSPSGWDLFRAYEGTILHDCLSMSDCLLPEFCVHGIENTSTMMQY